MEEQSNTNEVCTIEKRGNIFILTLTGNNEHRLNPTLITSIRSSLSQIKSQFLDAKPSSSSVLITTAHGKFFSNGYDIALVNSSPNPKIIEKTMDSQLKSLISDLISFPMPTIAAVNGHASAAGCILAMAHDYVIMRRDRGYLYMSEVDIGLVIPPWFMAVLRCKISGWKGRRRVVLMAEKVTAERGMNETGIVDQVFDGVEGTIDGALRLGESLVKRNWDGFVYSEIRKGLFKEVLDAIGRNETDGGGDGGGRVRNVHEFKPRL